MKFEAAQFGTVDQIQRRNYKFGPNSGINNSFLHSLSLVPRTVTDGI